MHLTTRSTAYSLLLVSNLFLRCRCGVGGASNDLREGGSVLEACVTRSMEIVFGLPCSTIVLVFCDTLMMWVGPDVRD